MSTRQLPPDVSLRSLKNQAKTLLHGHRSGSSEAVERFRSAHPRLNELDATGVAKEPLVLADALLVIAREYGFASWPKLLAAVTGEVGKLPGEPGWEWALWVPGDISLESSGCTGTETRSRSARGQCAICWENRPEDGALAVTVAASGELVERHPRAIAFDEDAARQPLHSSTSVWGNGLGLFSFRLPYSEVPHGTIVHLGVEIQTS